MYTKSLYNIHAIILKLILNELHILSYVYYVVNILTQSHIIINHICKQIVFSFSIRLHMGLYMFNSVEDLQDLRISLAMNSYCVQKRVLYKKQWRLRYFNTHKS